MDIGDSIKSLRIKKGLTQQQLADIVGLKAITIRKYESNDRQPSFEILDKIGKALGSFFFTFTFDEDGNCCENGIVGKKFGSPEPVKHILSDTELMLIKKFNTLNGLGKEEAIKRIDELTYITKYIDEE